MGEVYEAMGPFGGAPVVVKILRSVLAGSSEAAARMRREGELLADLEHPNVVKSHGYGVNFAGRPYVVLERLGGSTLRDVIRQRGPLPVAEALDHAEELLAALQAVHDAGIVHRDVKPSNVMLTHVAAGERRIKLIDFGVAKRSAEPAQAWPLTTFATREGLCLGTPRYVSPEQAAGLPVDARTDLYAAGVVLYTLVAGRGPFDEFTGVRAVLGAHVDRPPPRLSSVGKQPVPSRIEAVIMRALAKEPRDRFDSASTFADELSRARQQIREGRSPRPSSRHAGLPRLYPRRSLREACVLSLALPEASLPPYGPVPGPVHSDDVSTVFAAPTRFLPASFETCPTLVVEDVRSERRAGEARGGFFRGGVLCSAVAFFAIACCVAMWFVR